MWLDYQNGALVPVWTSNIQGAYVTPFQVIPQAWSLSLELMFYVIAPFLVRRHWLILVAIIATTYVLRSLGYSNGFNGVGFAYRFFPFEIGLFLAGVLSHRAYALLRSKDVMRIPVSAAIGAAFIGVLLVQQYFEPLDGHRFFILVALALPALFDLSRRSRLDGWLGELSYPIYLAHLAVGAVITSLLGSFEQGNWFAVGAVAGTVLVSIAYVRFIDAPFERWRQSRVTRARPAPEALSSVPQAAASI
jgi:peptidoglycan/LPS O-acetylase OafA/YrhL